MKFVSTVFFISLTNTFSFFFFLLRFYFEEKKKSASEREEKSAVYLFNFFVIQYVFE
jgi:hypothetical protein